MSLISAAVCVGVMSVMSTLEIRAVLAMAGRGKLRHGIHFRFVSELRGYIKPYMIHGYNINKQANRTTIKI